VQNFVEKSLIYLLMKFYNYRRNQKILNIMIASPYFSCVVNHMEKRDRLVSNTIDKDLLLLITVSGLNGKEISYKCTGFPFLSNFNENSVLSINFSKLQIPSFGKSVLLEASCSMRID